MKNFCVFIAAAAVALTACKKQPRVEQQSKPTPPATLSTAENPSPAVLPGDILDQMPRSEADVAWAEVEKAAQPPEYPEEWSTKQPSKEDIAAFEKIEFGYRRQGRRQGSRILHEASEGCPRRRS